MNEAVRLRDHALRVDVLLRQACNLLDHSRYPETLHTLSLVNEEYGSDWYSDRRSERYRDVRACQLPNTTAPGYNHSEETVLPSYAYAFHEAGYAERQVRDVVGGRARHTSLAPLLSAIRANQAWGGHLEVLIENGMEDAVVLKELLGTFYPCTRYIYRFLSHHTCDDYRLPEDENV